MKLSFAIFSALLSFSAAAGEIRIWPKSAIGDLKIEKKYFVAHNSERMVQYTSLQIAGNSFSTYECRVSKVDLYKAGSLDANLKTAMCDKNGTYDINKFIHTVNLYSGSNLGTLKIRALKNGAISVGMGVASVITGVFAVGLTPTIPPLGIFLGVMSAGDAGVSAYNGALAYRKFKTQTVMDKNQANSLVESMKLNSKNHVSLVSEDYNMFMDAFDVMLKRM